MDPSVRNLFDQVGISFEDLQADKEFAKQIYDIIDQHGGLEQVKKEQEEHIVPPSRTSLNISGKLIILPPTSLNISGKPVPLPPTSLNISGNPIPLPPTSLNISGKPIPLPLTSINISGKPILLPKKQIWG